MLAPQCAGARSITRIATLDCLTNLVISIAQLDVSSIKLQSFIPNFGELFRKF